MTVRPITMAVTVHIGGCTTPGHGSRAMADQPSTASVSSSAATEDEKKNSSQFVGFQIDDQEYAFRIEQIQ